MKEFNLHNLNSCRKKTARFRCLGIGVRVWTQARPRAHIPTLKADALIHGNCLNDDFPSHLATKELLSF